MTLEGVITEIHDGITGAKVSVTEHFGLLLFDDIMVKIESADLATAKIVGSFVGRVEQE